MKQLLIVDDENHVHESLKLLLMNYDVTIVSAYNGQEALNKIDENHDFDLIMLDWSMPVMDGGTFMEIMQERGLTNRVVVCSALASLVAHVRSKYPNIMGIISKPFDFQELTTLVDREFQLV